MRRLYFDWNASAPLRPEAAEAMRHAATITGNPSSLHAEGRAARQLIEDARHRVRQALDVGDARVVFTSGATEADNLAILGFAAVAELESLPRRLVVSAIEHSAVLGPARRLQERGWSLTLVKPDSTGRVAPGEILEAARGASLVSWMLVNNEVGTIQPISELAGRGVLALHTDASQAPGRLPLSFQQLGCTLLTLSGHKFGGPKGSGALVVKSESLVEPILHGGAHEFGLRAGTENVAAIAGFTAALECAVREQDSVSGRLRSLVCQLRDRLTARIPEVRIVTPVEGAVVNTLCALFPGLDGRALVIALDLEGVSASVGSACASGSLQPSHVLLSLGFSESEARGALRLSLGPIHTLEDIEDLVNRIDRVWRQLRRATV